jgi:hypothetical protein
MTSHVGRLYAAAAAVLAFFVLWAAIAAHPWRTSSADPRLTALAKREQLLRREAALVREIVTKRALVARAAARAAVANAAAANAAHARAQLASAQAQAQAQTPAQTQAAPSVRVVTLPPLTITRTS